MGRLIHWGSINTLGVEKVSLKAKEDQLDLVVQRSNRYSSTTLLYTYNQQQIVLGSTLFCVTAV